MLEQAYISNYKLVLGWSVFLARLRALCCYVFFLQLLLLLRDVLCYSFLRGAYVRVAGSRDERLPCFPSQLATPPRLLVNHNSEREPYYAFCELVPARSTAFHARAIQTKKARLNSFGRRSVVTGSGELPILCKINMLLRNNQAIYRPISRWIRP